MPERRVCWRARTVNLAVSGRDNFLEWANLFTQCLQFRSIWVLRWCTWSRFARVALRLPKRLQSANRLGQCYSIKNLKSPWILQTYLCVHLSTCWIFSSLLSLIDNLITSRLRLNSRNMPTQKAVTFSLNLRKLDSAMLGRTVMRSYQRRTRPSGSLLGPIAWSIGTRRTWHLWGSPLGADLV